MHALRMPDQRLTRHLHGMRQRAPKVVGTVLHALRGLMPGIANISCQRMRSCLDLGQRVTARGTPV